MKCWPRHKRIEITSEFSPSIYFNGREEKSDGGERQRRSSTGSFGGRERARAKLKKNRDCFTPGRFECVRMCVWLSFWLLFFLLDSLSLLFVGYAFLRGADDSLLSRRWGACGRDRSRTFVKTYSHSTGFLYPIKREKKRRRTVPLITFQLNTHAHGHTTQNGEKKEKRKKNQSEVLECIWWKVVYAWERITLWLIFYYPTSE